MHQCRSCLYRCCTRGIYTGLSLLIFELLPVCNQEDTSLKFLCCHSKFYQSFTKIFFVPSNKKVAELKESNRNLYFTVYKRLIKINFFYQKNFITSLLTLTVNFDIINIKSGCYVFLQLYEVSVSNFVSASFFRLATEVR